VVVRRKRSRSVRSHAEGPAQGRQLRAEEVAFEGMRSVVEALKDVAMLLFRRCGHRKTQSNEQLGEGQATVRTRVYLSYVRCLMLSIRKCTRARALKRKTLHFTINSVTEFQIFDRKPETRQFP